MREGWWNPYRVADHGYLSLEHDATRLSTFSLGYVPRLLQTESYMRALFAGWQVQRSRKWMENQFAVRTRRQERLMTGKGLSTTRSSPRRPFPWLIASSWCTSMTRDHDPM